MANVSLPNSQVPVVDRSTGLMNQQWYLFFNGFFQNSGGSGTIPVASGGTGITSGTANGVLFFSNPTTIGSSVGLGQYQVVIGGVSGSGPTTVAGTGTSSQVLLGGTPPQWGSISLVSTVTGILPISSGGTNTSSLTANGVILASSSSLVSVTSASGTVLTGRGATSSPAWSQTPVLGVPGASTGSIGFAGATAGTVTVKALSSTSTYSLTLPVNAGSSTNVLSTDGAGALYFASAGGAASAPQTSTSTHDISITGSQSITGLAGKPKALIFFGSANPGGFTYSDFNGFCDNSIRQYCLTSFQGSTGTTYRTGNSMAFIDVTGANEADFTVTSMDANGFTGTWAKSGSPTGTATFFFLAFF